MNVYYAGAEPECDNCPQQHSREGVLWCEYYQYSILNYKPQCMHSILGEKDD